MNQDKILSHGILLAVLIEPTYRFIFRAVDMNSSFKVSLFKHCYDRASGTFFVKTTDNRSAQILLENGIIRGANYADYSSYDALVEIMSQDEIKYSYTADLPFPIRHPLTASQAVSFLDEHGYMEFMDEQEALAIQETEAANALDQEDNHPKTTNRKKRYYRGQVIEETTDLKEEPTLLVQEIPQKERIYRGQRVAQ